MKRGQRALWRDSENCAVAVGPALPGCPVEVAVAGLDEPGDEALTFILAEDVQCGQYARGGDFEDRPIAVCRAAVVGCAVEVAVGGLEGGRTRGKSRPWS